MTSETVLDLLGAWSASTRSALSRAIVVGGGAELGERAGATRNTVETPTTRAQRHPLAHCFPMLEIIPVPAGENIGTPSLGG